MRKLKLFMATVLATTTLVTMIPQSLVFAADGIPVHVGDMEADQYSAARYALLNRVSLTTSLSNDGASYYLVVSGMSEVTEISGTMTLYKKNTSGSYYEVSSEDVYEDSNYLSLYSTLPTDGSGSYRLEFVGTVHTPSTSEDFSKTITKSY